MTFSIGRTQVVLSFGTVLFAAFCLVAGEGRTLLFALLSLAVHETAHIVAAKNLGCPVAKISIYPFGAVMRLDGLFCDARAERIIAAAGPLGSLTFSAMLRLMSLVLADAPWSETLIATNLAIAALNLLPAFPLDGGRIFRTLLLRSMRERTAKTLMLLFTAMIALGMLGAGVYLFSAGAHAWSLFAVPPFLLLSACKEWRMPDAGIVSRMMERQSTLRTGATLKAETVVLSETSEIGDAIAALSGTRFTIFRVMRADGMTELDERTLLSAAAKFGPHIALKNVILQLTDGK